MKVLRTLATTTFLMIFLNIITYAQCRTSSSQNLAAAVNEPDIVTGTIIISGLMLNNNIINSNLAPRVGTVTILR